jgi:predicted transcriptional regulator
MDIIKKTIACTHCRLTLEWPVILPCGNSICKKHVQTADDGQSLDSFYCRLCEHDHKVPENGFPPNKIAEDLIRTKIEQLNLGVEYENLTMSFRTAKAYLKDLRLLKNDPTLFIADSIGEFKNLIDLKREHFKYEIDMEADNLIRELDDFHAQCELSVKSTEFTSESERIEHLISSVSAELDKWQKQVDVVEINVDKWKKLSEQSTRRVHELQQCKRKLKNDLLCNQLWHFKDKQMKFNFISFLELAFINK